MTRDWIFLNPTMRQIAKPICDAHGVSLDELRSPSRRREYAWPRQEVITAIVASGRYTKSAAGRFMNRTFWTADDAIKAVNRRALAEREVA